jgi:hypothetical protein
MSTVYIIEDSSGFLKISGTFIKICLLTKKLEPNLQLTCKSTTLILGYSCTHAIAQSVEVRTSKSEGTRFKPERPESAKKKRIGATPIDEV